MADADHSRTRVAGRDRNDDTHTILTDLAGRTKISHAQPDAVSADLVAINDALVIDLDSMSDVMFFARGAAHVGFNLAFEYSPDTTTAAGYTPAATPANGNWYPLLAKNVGVLAVPGTATGVLTSNSMSSWELSAPAATRIRARVTARTSGTLTVSGVASTAARPVTVGVTGSVTALPGTSASSLGKAEDAVHASGDTGVAVLGVRAAAPVAPASGTGDYSIMLVDAEGKLIPAGSADPINTVQGIVDLTTTAATALLAAGAAGMRAYVTDLTLENTGAAVARVTISDGVTRMFSVTVPAGTTWTKTFGTPLRGTAATAVNAALTAAGTVTASLQGYRGI